LNMRAGSGHAFAHLSPPTELPARVTVPVGMLAQGLVVKQHRRLCIPLPQSHGTG
jgi:hypothetical protein